MWRSSGPGSRGWPPRSTCTTPGSRWSCSRRASAWGAGSCRSSSRTASSPSSAPSGSCRTTTSCRPRSTGWGSRRAWPGSTTCGGSRAAAAPSRWPSSTRSWRPRTRTSPPRTPTGARWGRCWMPSRATTGRGPSRRRACRGRSRATSIASRGAPAGIRDAWPPNPPSTGAWLAATARSPMPSPACCPTSASGSARPASPNEAGASRSRPATIGSRPTPPSWRYRCAW